MTTTDIEKFPESAAKIGKSDNICREDLIGNDATLTIAEAAPGKGGVIFGTARLPNRTKEEPAYLLCFKETQKKLVLNATNRKTLQRMFGNKTKEWVDKKITLYFEPNVRCPDGSKGGTRIRQVDQLTAS